MRPRKGEMAFTVKERIVLHLGEQRSTRDQDVPNTLTQEGISLATGVRRGNVARALKEMERAGMVETKRARPSGRTHVSKYYQLDGCGAAELGALMERAGNLDVRIGTPGGERIVPLSEIPAYVPAGCTLSEVAGSVKFSELDLKEFEKRRVKRGFGGYAVRAIPDIGDFYGRSPEMAKASEWWVSRKSKMLVITGIAGIGKTAFVSRMVRDWSSRSHVCWIPLKRWTSAHQVAGEVGDFLSALGRNRTASLLSAGGWNLEAAGRALAEDARKLKLVLVFDDAHVARADVSDIVSILLEIARAEPGLKIAVVGRKCPRIHDGRDVMDGTVSELKLGFLDSESSRKILASRKVPAGRLVKLCGGHPLFLRLAPAECSASDEGLAGYLRTEVFSGLSDGDWEAMALLCLSREPVSVDALAGPLGVGRGRLDGLVERGLAMSVSTTALGAHDILADFVRKRLSGSERRKAHLLLGRHYSASVGPASGLEAIYHLCKAGEEAEARVLFGKLAAELIGKGFVRGLDEAADAMCGGKVEFDPKMLISVGMVYGHVGRWSEAALKLGSAVALAREARMPTVECEALCALGELCLHRGMMDEARRALDQGIKLSVKMGSKESEARARYFMGSLLETGDGEKAEGEFDKARELSEACGSTPLLALAFYGKGRIEEARRHLGRARYYKERALNLLDGGDEKTTILKLLMSLGKNSFSLRDVPGAVGYYNRAISLARETGNLPMEGMALSNLGGAMIEKPDLTSAEDALTKAREILSGIGDLRMLVSVHNNLSLVHFRRGNFTEAVNIARSGVEAAERYAQPVAIARALTFLGIACKADGKADEARVAFERAGAIAHKVGDKMLEKEISKEFFGMGHRTQPAQ
jgi:tetratricopeptide (TPR) repeat protein/DNA-binding PadR family transcriptional regulator